MPKREPIPHHPAWRDAPLRYYLRLMRQQHGMKQAELSRQLGYSASRINAWEAGYAAPDFVQLSEWLSVFDLRVAAVPIVEGRPSRSQEEAKRRVIAEQRLLEAASGSTSPSP